MPIYDHECERGHITPKYKKLDERNDPVPCQTCGHDAQRAFISAPHMGAIPGIHNKVNKDWQETGQVLYDPNRPEHLPKYKNPE